MDSGDIIASAKVNISEDTYLDELYRQLSLLGRDLLIETLPGIIKGTNKRIKQDESKVTFGLNITKEEEKIDFNNSAQNIHNKIRGLSSVPGAYAYLKDKRVKIYRSEVTDNPSSKIPGTIEDIKSDGMYVSTKDNIIKLLDIQIEGKKRCLIKDFLNGNKKEEYIGERFK